MMKGLRKKRRDGIATEQHEEVAAVLLSASLQRPAPSLLIELPSWWWCGVRETMKCKLPLLLSSAKATSSSFRPHPLT